jgi:hypothetical protein
MYNKLNHPKAVVYQVANNVDSVKHYSPEECTRAKEAFELCARLGHANDNYIVNSLNFGIFNDCHLTSQD